jgi:hypothetical protein
MGRQHAVKWTPLFLLFAGVGATGAEVTPSQSTNYLNQELSDVADVFAAGEIYLYEEETLTGFQKFDPTLGELTEVRFTVTGSASLEMVLSSSELIDEELPFTLLYDPDGSGFSNFADVGLVYAPTGTNIGLSVVTDSISAPRLGYEDEDPSGWSFESFYVDDFQSEEFFIHDGVDSPAREGSLLMSNPNVNPTDFIGVGEVTGLIFQGFGEFNAADVITDNLASAQLEAVLRYTTGEVTLEYVYTPASKPTATGYERTGSSHRIHFRGEAGRNDWRVLGGPDLSGFPNDHTAASVFVETSAGVYQADLTLPELTTSRYFFVVEAGTGP